MRPRVSDLLRELPPFNNKSVLVEPVQDVPDIMREVCKAHTVFAEDYDTIYEFFLSEDLFDVCADLFDFIKQNIRYVQESEQEQTTKSPAALLALGYGDCKHYSGFIAGVLDAIRRNTGRPVNWCYRFASYNLFSSDPGHVFVVVRDPQGEIWIDPVLSGFDDRSPSPTRVVDKKINMSLYRVSGVSEYDQALSILTGGSGAAIGWTMETSAGYTTSGPAIVPKIGDPRFGFDFLGLSRYGSLVNTDLNQLTAQLQAEINEGPSPHVLPASLVKKVATENMQHWNFFYDTGTSPVSRNWQNDPDLRNFLMLTVTPDGRLTFDRNEEPPHDAPQIHKLADWANYLIQAYSDEPYYVTIEHLKRLGKGWNTPQEGSLWHVIHTGDVNFAKIDDFINNIPGLAELLDTFGIDLNTLLDKAGAFLGARTGTGGSTGFPTLPRPDGMNPMLIAAAGAVAAYFLSKNLLISAGVGVGAYMLLNKRQTVYTPQQSQLPTTVYK